MDHRSLVSILKQDATTLRERLQCILKRIHQQRVKILYKLGPDIFIADCLLCQNHEKDKNSEQEISIDAVIQQQMSQNACQYKIYSRQHPGWTP